MVQLWDGSLVFNYVSLVVTWDCQIFSNLYVDSIDFGLFCKERVFLISHVLSCTVISKLMAQCTIIRGDTDKVLSKPFEGSHPLVII